jgi:hypothetical protein
MNLRDKRRKKGLEELKGKAKKASGRKKKRRWLGKVSAVLMNFKSFLLF